MKKHYLFYASFILLIASCRKETLEESTIESEASSENSEQIHEHSFIKALLPLLSDEEKFETGSKTTYTNGSVTLASGSWTFNDALLGTSSSDKKISTKAARIRNVGEIYMNFNLTKGASTITINHAKYGTDPSSTWDLMSSYNGGSTWNVIASVSTTTSSLKTQNFVVNGYGNVRFKIKKKTGGALNIDNITVYENNGTPSQDDHLVFGNPSGANSSTTMPNNYLMSKGAFKLSYNNSKGTANWVAWHLSSAWKGTIPRCDCFASDLLLPSSFFKAKESHYTNSGYDKGHLCSSDDRDGIAIHNKETFYMTNIIPQAPKNNQIVWKALESFCQNKALNGYEMFIYAGVTGVGGIGSNGPTSYLNGGNITVPEKLWKVIIMLPNGSNDLNRITSATRVISVIMPNTQASMNQPWGSYRVKVDDIETATGIDLLNLLPTSLQSTLESVIDNGPTI